MATTDLKHKPLLEAILEVRWALVGQSPGVQADPHYKILLGRLYDRVRDEYPEHEQLPSAQIPDEITGYTVKHRFRSGRGQWPLLQIGPGILTLNDTSGYTWPDFRRRALEAVHRLFNSHPQPQELNVNGLLLRYIDAVDFDYPSNNVFAFLKDKMNVSVSLPESLFVDTGVCDLPAHFNWRASFACDNPKGMVHARFATGQKQQGPGFIWETQVQSVGADVSDMPARFERWLDAAHDVTHDWFFKLIEGDLERSFRGG